MGDTAGDRFAAVLERAPKPRPIHELIDRRADCHASGAVMLAAYITKGNAEFSLCGHHLARHRARLEAEGWTVMGMTRTVTAGVGTESTPNHYALGGS